MDTLTKEKHYEAAWRIVGNGDVKERDFQKKTNKQFVYVIILLLGYMQFYLKTLDTSKCGKENNRIVAVSPPYTSYQQDSDDNERQIFRGNTKKVV